MPASRTQLLGGGFQDAEGNLLSLGYLRLRLNQDEEVTGVGQIAAGIVLTINLDANGDVSTSPVQSVWANDVVTPVNSFYIVTGYTAAGQLAFGPNNQQITSGGVGGGTFDTGTWIPNTVLSWFYPAALGPTGPAGTTGATGPTGAAPSGPPTPTEILAGLNPLRVWKAVPNSGTLGAIIGLAPNTIANASALINATATATNSNSYSTSAGATDQASITFTGITGSGINPNVFQIFSTQTLKAAKWQTALVDTANVRVWMALTDVFSGNVTSLESDTPALHLIGFRYSTAAGDTTWQAVCSNSASQTTVNTGIAVDTLGHAFGIAVSQTSIVFQIDGTTVATIATNIPANTVRFGDILSVDNVGLANVRTVAVSAFTTSE